MSSKGQLVIPQHMRAHLRVREQVVIVRDGGRLPIKTLDSLASMKDDLTYAATIDQAWNRYEQGYFRTSNVMAFVSTLRKA
jgi:bifunctional DNA-binding transcriptional regulator/antitoxin component of YhaV-PrlF toxin-antitoxin module